MDRISLIKAIQLKALDNTINQPIDLFERKVRRWFSKNCNTPYIETFKIPWDEILLNYYEATLEERSYNEVIDIMTQELPELRKDEEDENQAFADAVERSLKEKEKKANKVINQINEIADKINNKAQSLRETIENNKPIPQQMKLSFGDDEGNT